VIVKFHNKKLLKLVAELKGAHPNDAALVMILARKAMDATLADAQKLAGYEGEVSIEDSDRTAE